MVLSRSRARAGRRQVKKSSDSGSSAQMTMSRAALSRPMPTSMDRQPYSGSTPTATNAVMIEPNGQPACTKPTAKLAWRSGANSAAIAVIDTPIVPTPTPTKSRAIMRSVRFRDNPETIMAAATSVNAPMITARRPTRSARGAINRQPTAIPPRLALKSTPSLSGLTRQLSDKTGAMNDMMSKSVPSSMLSMKHSAITNRRVAFQSDVSLASAWQERSIERQRKPECRH
jgi:hypothetical protein